MQGLEQGIQQGRIEGQRSILENLLRVRLGELESVLIPFIAPLSALSAPEFTMLLVQLSTLSGDENGLQQARQLLAEGVLRMRFGQLDDRLISLIPCLLALSSEDLALLLSQLPQLSPQELFARFETVLGETS